jgi:hypothetical protein
MTVLHIARIEQLDGESMLDSLEVRAAYCISPSGSSPARESMRRV